jgi:hypothetical protein
VTTRSISVLETISSSALPRRLSPTPFVEGSPSLGNAERRIQAYHKPRSRGTIRIQELVENYAPSVAGTKRKHEHVEPSPPLRVTHGPNHDTSFPFSTTQPTPMSSRNHEYAEPSPAFEDSLVVPPSPLLSPRSHDDLGNGQPWSLDELNEALPPSFHQWDSAPPIPPRHSDRGKGRVMLPSIPRWDTASIIESSSSSSATGSSNTSIYSSYHGGSVISLAPTTASKNRAFESGTCKLWYRNGSTLGSFDVLHIEIQHILKSNSATHGTRLIVRNERGQDIVDDLWMSVGKNTSPFLEHGDIVNAFRLRDPNINHVVRFTPHSNSVKGIADLHQAVLRRTA